MTKLPSRAIGMLCKSNGSTSILIAKFKRSRRSLHPERTAQTGVRTAQATRRNSNAGNHSKPTFLKKISTLNTPGIDLSLMPISCFSILKSPHFTASFLIIGAFPERPLRFFSVIEMQLFGTNDLIVLMTFTRNQNKVSRPGRSDRLSDRDRSVDFNLVVDA